MPANCVLEAGAGDADDRALERGVTHPAARQTQLEMPLHVRPLLRQDAVHHAVAHRAVAAGVVVPEDAVALRAQRL